MAKLDKPSKKSVFNKLDAKPVPGWVKQEEHAAKTFGGKRTIGSGNKPMHKGDVKSPEFMVEAKFTATRNWTFKAEWLEKISDEAQQRQRLPAMHLHFDNVRTGCERAWIMLPESVFKRMKEGGLYDGSGFDSDVGQ